MNTWIMRMSDLTYFRFSQIDFVFTLSCLSCMNLKNYNVTNSSSGTWIFRFHNQLYTRTGTPICTIHAVWSTIKDMFFLLQCTCTGFNIYFLCTSLWHLNWYCDMTIPATHVNWTCVLHNFPAYLQFVLTCFGTHLAGMFLNPGCSRMISTTNPLNIIIW